MKRLTLLLVLILLSFITYSQEVVKIKELGFTTANLNDFGITYRQGDDKSIWRFNAITSSVGFRKESNDSRNISNSSITLGFQAGKEWRKILDPKFELRFGADIGFRYSTSSYESFNNVAQTINYKTTSKNYQPSINAVLGFNFVLTNNFLIGAEFQPSISYGKLFAENYNSSTQETEYSESESFSFGFSTDAIRLSFLYRF